MYAESAMTRLLENACPSIRYRLCSEILKQSPTLPEMVSLQCQIMQDGAVIEISNRQQPDGWLSWNFHGYDSTEADIRLLCEKGVDKLQPVLQNALRALEENPERLARGLGKVGDYFDRSGLGGGLLIRATLFAHAGVEDKAFVRKQIELALACFEAVMRSILSMT